MMRDGTTGAVALGQVAERTAMLEVACSRCGRRGRYGTARLVERHGAGMPMPELRRVLAGDCPRWASRNIYEMCDVHFPELPGLLSRRTLRTALLALALGVTTGAAHARDYVLRDREGRTTGTLAPMPGSRDDFSIRDRAGRQVGTVHRLPGASDSYSVRDQGGRSTGTATRRR